MVIDVSPHVLRRALQPFRWLGLNAITIYILAEVLVEFFSVRIVRTSQTMRIRQFLLMWWYFTGRCSGLGLLLVLLVHTRAKSPKYILVCEACWSGRGGLAFRLCKIDSPGICGRLRPTGVYWGEDEDDWMNRVDFTRESHSIAILFWCVVLLQACTSSFCTNIGSGMNDRKNVLWQVRGIYWGMDDCGGINAFSTMLHQNLIPLINHDYQLHRQSCCCVWFQHASQLW